MEYVRYISAVGRGLSVSQKMNRHFRKIMNPAFLITVHKKISEQLSEMVRVSDVSGHCSKIDFVTFLIN